MSFQAMAWAAEKKLPAAKKIVLLMLANRVNSDTGKCVPKIKTLAEDCGLSESGVKLALKYFVEMGWVSVIERFAESVQISNAYQIHMQNRGSQDDPPHHSNTGGGSPVNPGGVTKKPRGGHEVTTESGIESVIEPKSSASAPAGDGFDDFWSAYPKRQGKRDAQMAWKKVKPAELAAIMSVLEQFKLCEAWTKSSGQFIPLPATWIRGRRWEDELATAPSGNWFDTLDGIKGKAAELCLPMYTGYDTNDWLRYVARVWVAVGDGPHWDKESSVYPLAVSLRNLHNPSVGNAIDSLIKRVAA